MIDFSIRRDKSRRIMWSEDQISYIINEYKKNPQTGIIASQFGVTKEAIRALLKRNGIHVLSAYEYGVRNNPRNIKAFAENTRAEAYWLGFLYADGNVRDSNEIQINLQESDKDHLKKFRTFLKAENNVITETTKRTPDQIYKGVHFSIRDKYIANNLKARGCIPRKSLILTFPNEEAVPKKYIWDFIRGYFDGDGCLSIDKRSNNFLIDFVGTYEFLLGIKEYSGKNNIKIEKIGNENSNTYRFRLSGNNNIKDFITKMYENSTEETRLDRKYQKYLEYINYSA